MEIIFCKGWSRYHKKTIGELSRKQALKLDEESKPYTVLLVSSDIPHCFIEINLGCFGVGFLDEHLREYLRYSFECVDEERVFLSEATYREYVSETDSVTAATIFRFDPDGNVIIDKAWPPSKKFERSKTQADVSGNWGPKPAFGDYGEIIRKERFSGQSLEPS